MAATRAHEAQRFLREDPSISEPFITVRAGEDLLLRVGAVDRKSGLAEIIAWCRSRENYDLCSTGTWSLRCAKPQPGDHYYPIVVPIPKRSPTVIWELHAIALCDMEGNQRTYHAGIDFEEMLFQVEGMEGVDCTPPRLLGIRFGRA
jgi:hypothetical protein